MVNLCWCIDRIRRHLGSGPPSCNSCPSTNRCIQGPSRVQTICETWKAETANVLTPLIWQVDETMFRAQTESESASKKSAEKMIDNKKNRKMAAELCDELCVCVGKLEDGCLVVSLRWLFRMRECSLSLQQYNPIPCSACGVSFYDTATLTVLLFLHYFWQCKWLITLKMALCGEKNPGIMGVKSLAFRLQPFSIGLRSPSKRISQTRGKISHPYLMTVIVGHLLTPCE